VRLDGGRLLILEDAVNPIFDRTRSPRGVDHRIALREVAAAQLLQVRFEWTGDVFIEGSNDLVRLLARHAEYGLDARDEDRSWERKEKFLEEVGIPLISRHRHNLGRTSPELPRALLVLPKDLRVRPMRTGSELLAVSPPAPLSGTLVSRPVRVCVFVPDIEGVPWERLVEHALASQMRVWGGTSNLVVPTGWEVADDEVFWRVVDRYDPDIVGLHVPVYGDLEDVAPDQYGQALARLEERLTELGFDEDAQANEKSRFRNQPAWMWDISSALRSQLVKRVAPLHLNETGPRDVHLDGTSEPAYPLVDVTALREIPGSVLDISTTLDELDQLLLTHAVGRLVPPLKRALEGREVAISPVVIEHEQVLFGHLWPNQRMVSDYTYPNSLPATGLAQRLFIEERGQVVVVVGDDRRDFLLFHGLSRLRPYIYWLPSRRMNNEPFIRELTEATRRAAQGSGANAISVTTASSDEDASAAVELLNDLPGRGLPEASRVEWSSLVPRSSLSVADARSERRVSLLRHEGETQDLPTPVPASVSSDDPFSLRWMVDVEIQGWKPARHPSLAREVFRGPLVSSMDSRASLTGPAYFGLSPLTQAFLGLEGSTARPRLRPRPVVEQVSDVLRPLGWEASLSDKGAFALHSARLFGGVEELSVALRVEAKRRLLDAYLTPTTTNDPGRFLKDTRRRYLSLAEAGGVVGEGDISALAADLYDRGVLVRGHILKCEQCRATSFYSLTEEQEFSCVRCRTVQRATRFSWLGTPEPDFRYALAEVLYQFLDNNGHLPLLAAYEQFVVGRSRERQPFDFAFEVDLTSPEGELSEHDIVALWGAELWLGEATVGERLGKTNAEEIERLGRLKEVAEALSVRGLIFATTGEFSSATKQNVKAAFTDPVWPEIAYVENFDAGQTQGSQ
jgi:hypothetical protein